MTDTIEQVRSVNKCLGDIYYIIQLEDGEADM